MNPITYGSLLAESTTPSEGIQNALQTGFQSIASDMTTTVTNILPIVLGVVGLVLVVTFAIKFFKRNSQPR